MENKQSDVNKPECRDSWLIKVLPLNADKKLRSDVKRSGLRGLVLVVQHVWNRSVIYENENAIDQ